ncbi:hypothetical protein GCM10010201_18280 [Pilimelia columellifera subsp. columellifera]|uniref:Guanylate cyclase domain-containing protein n=1 Tax=Pilimelia columellifera subsp. columellifera TaxID=706583 RepID=A0ABN3NFM0_9ACTN
MLPTGLVTFLFTDIEGSTRLAHRLGDAYHDLLGTHRTLLRRTLTDHGAELFTEGDSFFVVFGRADHAIVSTLAAQRALLTHPWPGAGQPRVRMGLHTGWARPRGGEYASPEVHRAARIAAAGHGGQTLCSGETIRHAHGIPAAARVTDLGLHQLRGFDGRSRLYQVDAEDLPGRFPRPRTCGVVRHNLPAELSPLIGREQDRRELTGALAQHRLVTLTGPAGVGKSRLAVSVGGGLSERFADGVWHVDLAQATTAGAIVASVAAALGVRIDPHHADRGGLGFLATGAELLLVLDTCDVAPAAARAAIAGLLASGGGLRVLAVGRSPLGLPGECVWRLAPLSLVPARHGARDDATRLLLARAETARGGRPVDGSELAALGTIAARLDGLPQALELAGSALGATTAHELGDRLDSLLAPSPPDDVGGGRLTTAASVAWSYRRLPASQARLLRWLAVFAAPVSLDRVRWLAQGEPGAALAGLVDASLVQLEQGADGASYRLLSPIRAYAAAALAASGEEAAARDRHAAWICGELERMAHGTSSRSPAVPLQSFDPLVPDARAALRWCAVRARWRGLRIVRALGVWSLERGDAAEARRWLCELYDGLGGVHRLADGASRTELAALSPAFMLHSQLAAVGGAQIARAVFAGRAVLAGAASGDPTLSARVRLWAPAAAEHLDEAACQVLLDRADSQDRPLPVELLPVASRLAERRWRRGDLDAAAALMAAARPAEAAQPLTRGRRDVDMLLGVVALGRGDLVAAHDHLKAALRSRVAFGFRRAACETIAAVAVRCALGGEPLRAARLLGAAAAGLADLGGVPGPFAGFVACQQAAARAVAPDDFDAAFAQGSTWSLMEAADVALAVEHPDLALGYARFVEMTLPGPQGQRADPSGASVA